MFRSGSRKIVFSLHDERIFKLVFSKKRGLFMSSEKKKPLGKIKPKKVPADQAIDGGGEKASRKADKKPKEDRASINDAEGWEGIQENWVREKQQNIQAQARRFFDTDEEVPLSKHILLMVIVSFVVIFILWANFAELDEVTRGDGKVIPSSDVQALQILDAGLVKEFLVREGDRVEAGEVLVRLDSIQADSDLGANEARYLGLLASITRLAAEAEGKATFEFPAEVMKGSPSSVTEELNAFNANRRAMQGQMSVLEQQMRQREQEVRELNTRIGDTRSVIALQRREADLIRPLVQRGSAPELELLQLQRGIKEKQAELNGYTTSLPRAKSAIEEANARIEEIRTNAKAQAQTELSTKLIEMNEIKQRLSALEQRQGLTALRSPVDGTIQEITVNTVGGVVRPGEDFIKIVPEDDQLIIEAKVRPADRAFIFPGQKAVIKLTAYDFSIYGGLNGELVSISADTFEDQEGNTSYKVKLRTEETVLRRKGEELEITVGMVASVDILTGKKTVMQYLMKPLNKTRELALRER